MTVWDKLPQGWQKTLASLYEAGASDTEVRAALRITRACWDSLCSDVQDSSFSELVDFGRAISKAWWLTQGRINLTERSFNANLWHINMKNRFGWSDKTEVHTTTSIKDLDTDELEQMARELNKQATRSIKG